MPIDDSEWDDGELDNTRDQAETVPVGDHDAETDLVGAFLDANAGRAYTAREIAVGVGFDEADDPDAVGSAVSKASPRTNVTGQVGEEVTDPVGDLTAGDTSLDAVHEALDELVEEGTVVAKDVETDEGTETYYRRNTGNEQVDG